MKNILLLLISLLIVTKISSQEIDMSQVSLDPNDTTKPFLGKEVIDTLATCKAVKAELESIATKGIKALDSRGHSNLTHRYKSKINVEVQQLCLNFMQEIREQAAAEAEKEYQRILKEAKELSQEKIDVYYIHRNKWSGYFEATKALDQLLPSVLEQTYYKWHTLDLPSGTSPQLEKLSKELQEELPKNKEKVIKYLASIREEKITDLRKIGFRTQAETNILRDYINKIMEQMPPVDNPECYKYIEKEFQRDYHSEGFFCGNNVLKKNKKKIVTRKNPNYFKNDSSWDWLSEKEKERVVKHFPVEDTYYVDKRHPEYIIRNLNVGIQYSQDVYAALKDDVLAGVTNNHARGGNLYYDLEQVLCLYEFEHNKYDVNKLPTYVKDCIRYSLITFKVSNVGYSYDNSWEYTKKHKSETYDISEKYIKQQHLDHAKLFDNHRVEKVDGTTFRHYIGKDEQIVILQKYVYGNYCMWLFPFSKVTTLNPKDYIINKNVINKKKILTCYYVVEKYK